MSDVTPEGEDLRVLKGIPLGDDLGFKVGQTWLTRIGREVTIVDIIFFPSEGRMSSFPIRGGDGLTRRVDGLWSGSYYDDDDLVALVYDASAAFLPNPKYVAYKTVGPGWEIMDTQSKPVRTFVTGLTQEQATTVAKELNHAFNQR